MATYQIEWKESAHKELRRLPHPMVGRIITAVDALAENPFLSGVMKLAGRSIPSASVSVITASFIPLRKPC